MRKLENYWPSFMAELLEFQRLAKAEQPEIDSAWKEAQEAPRELWLFTMGEHGVRRYEIMLGIALDESLSLEQRRTRVINRLMMYPPFTLRYTQQLMDTLAGGSERIMLDLDAWVLTVSVGFDDAFLLNEARETLHKLKPAAVVMVERRFANVEKGLHLGGFAQMYRLISGGVTV